MGVDGEFAFGGCYGVLFSLPLGFVECFRQSFWQEVPHVNVLPGLNLFEHLRWDWGQAWVIESLSYYLQCFSSGGCS